MVKGNIDVEVDGDVESCFGCFEGASKSVDLRACLFSCLKGVGVPLNGLRVDMRQV